MVVLEAVMRNLGEPELYTYTGYLTVLTELFLMILQKTKHSILITKVMNQESLKRI
jgi:hypothetical protein